MNDYYDKTVHDVLDIKIPIYAFIMLCSKRRSGKWVLCRWLLKNICDNYDIDFIVLFSVTAMFNNDYDFIDKQFIFDFDKTDEKVDKIMEYQKKYKLQKKKCPNGIIVFDDINLHKSTCKKITDLSSLGRHFNLFTILWLQYTKALRNWGWSIRNNVDMLFYNDLNMQGEIGVYECVHIPFSYKQFHEFTDANNSNYTFLLYDGNENDKKKRIKLVKAKLLKLKFI